MRRFVRVAALTVPFALAFAAAWVPLPYYAVGPGPANDVDPLIDVEGVPRYPSDGQLIMTTVRFQQVTALGSLVAWIDESQFVVGEDEIFPPGADREQEPSEPSHRWTRARSTRRSWCSRSCSTTRPSMAAAL